LTCRPQYTYNRFIGSRCTLSPHHHTHLYWPTNSYSPFLFAIHLSSMYLDLSSTEASFIACHWILFFSLKHSLPLNHIVMYLLLLSLHCRCISRNFMSFFCTNLILCVHFLFVISVISPLLRVNQYNSPSDMPHHHPIMPFFDPTLFAAIFLFISPLSFANALSLLNILIFFYGPDNPFHLITSLISSYLAYILPHSFTIPLQTICLIISLPCLTLYFPLSFLFLFSSTSIFSSTLSISHQHPHFPSY